MAPDIDLPISPEDLDVRVQITQKDDSLVIRIQGEVLFGFNMWDITPEAKKPLGQAGAIIRSSRPRRIDIDGHTDGKGDDKYNMGFPSGAPRP